MGIDISREVEALLIDQARNLGISVDELLKILMSERSMGRSVADHIGAPLPLWHLGTEGSLNRRDIYTDVG